MAEFFDWQPSERYGELRNDGRSVHHRNELEKVVAVIGAKISELKALAMPSQSDSGESPLPLGGS